MFFLLLSNAVVELDLTIGGALPSVDVFTVVVVLLLVPLLLLLLDRVFVLLLCVLFCSELIIMDGCGCGCGIGGIGVVLVGLVCPSFKLFDLPNLFLIKETPVHLDKVSISAKVLLLLLLIKKSWKSRRDSSVE